MSHEYQPANITLRRLEQLGEELGTASPVKYLAKLRLEGFSDRAIEEKLEGILNRGAIRRILKARNIPYPRSGVQTCVRGVTRNMGHR